MSFKIQNFCWVGGKHGCQIFAYKTEDTIEEITSDNYFKNIQGKIFINDVIIIIQNSGLKYIKVAEYSYREGLQIKTEIISSGGEISDIDIPSFSESIPLKNIENGSSGISNEMSRSDHQHPLIEATTDEKGSIELATEEEAIEGADNEKAITPLTNQKHFEEQQATNENINNGDDVKKYINPKQLKEALEQKQNKLTNIDNTLNIVNNVDNTSNINLAISNTDNILLKEVDGLKVNINLSYDNTTGILKLTGKDNTEIATIDLPLSSFLKSSRVEKNPVNPDNAGEILDGTYLILTFTNEDGEDQENYIDLSKLVDVYTSTNKAISIEDYEITLNVDNASNLIINDNGLSVAGTHIIISKQEKEKYDNYETNKQDKLIAGDLIEINEATDTISVKNVYNKTETDNLLNLKQNKLTAGNNIDIEEKTDEGTGEVLETIINSYSILQVEELPVNNINNKIIYKLAIKNDGGDITGYDLYYHDEINGFVKITKDKEIIKDLEKTLNIIDNTYKIKTDLKNIDNNIIASNELDITENVVNSNTEFSSFINAENSDKKFITEGYLNKVMTNIPEPINDNEVVNKKYVDQNNKKFLGIYKDNTSIKNYNNGDIIYNNGTQNYQSFNEKTSSWENFNDLRTLQSIKSYQTSIRIPENSPLQFSKRLKEGSTVELEEVLTSSYTRFRLDMDYTQELIVEDLPKTQKHNGDIFRLKDESLILYTCEATVDENYNVTETEKYTYIRDNRKVDLNFYEFLQPFSSDWSFDFDETFGMFIKDNIISLNGEVRFSKKPTISAGFNSVFKIDTSIIKEGYIIDANYFTYDYIDFFKTDNILIKVSDEYNSSITKTNIIDGKGNISINIHCSSRIANSLNSGNGSICFANYNIYLGKR